MFRMLKLKPPNGWSTVAWELVIVTLGVLIALAAQQWAESRSWSLRARAATIAIREEVMRHHISAVEWRIVEPCIQSQIDVLQRRVLASDDTLDPAPIHSEPGFDAYVLRMPNRNYNETAWQAAISDGVNSHLDKTIRAELSDHYVGMRRVHEMNEQNNLTYQRLLSLSRPIPLDPMVRYALLQTLDELRGRVELMGHLSGQMIDHITVAGMLPPEDVERRVLANYGTYRFCRERRLPLRSLREARTPIPN